jgi:cell division initiation protein
MNVTPLDLRQQHFRIVMRGFDKTEVLAFLIEAADDYEAAMHEADRQRQDVARLEGQVAEHREHERNLSNTLLTAQRLADEIADSARTHAATIIKDAEARATLVLDKAQARMEDVQREIDGLRLKRREAETAVESLIATLKSTLDFVREQQARERDDRADKVVIHRPRHTEGRDTMAGWSQPRTEPGTAVPPAAVAR